MTTAAIIVEKNETDDPDLGSARGSFAHSSSSGTWLADGTWEFLLCACFPQKFHLSSIYLHNVCYSKRLHKSPLLSSSSNCALDLEQSATLAWPLACAPPGPSDQTECVIFTLCVEIELSVFFGGGDGVSLPSSKHHNLFPPASALPIGSSSSACSLGRPTPDRSSWSTMTQ